MSNKTIYLDDAIDAVGSMLHRKFGIGGDLAEITLAGLPSAQPERKKGTYTESGENDEWYCWYATCNECGKEWMGSRNFCPNCGADMR